MSLYYLAGEKSNLVGRGPNAVTASGTVNANFPLANLYAGRPRKPFSFSESVADERVIIDGQLVTDGGFEGTLSNAWTDADTGTGASTQDATPKSGTFSLKLVPGASGTATQYQDVTVRSGERLRLQAAIRQDGAGAVGVQVQNLQTGLYLNSSGSWVAYSAPGLSGVATSADTAAAFSDKSQEFQVEDRATCNGRNLVTLRIQPFCDDVITGYVDDVELFPAVNFLGVFSHNFDAILTPTWRSDTVSNFASATTRGTPTVYRPNFYAYLSTAIYARYWDLLLSGTQNASPDGLNYPRIGELVMGYAETIAQAQRQGWGDDYELPQARVETPERDQHVASRGDWPVRTLRLAFAHTSLSQRNEVRDEILGRTEHGRLPLVVVPKDDEPDVVFGRCRSDWGLARAFNATYITDALTIDEDPHMDWIDG